MQKSTHDTHMRTWVQILSIPGKSMAAPVASGLQRAEIGEFGDLLDASLDQGSVRHWLKKIGQRWLQQVT